MKQKTCKACRKKFTPVKPMQIVCNWECGMDWVVKQREKTQAEKKKAERKADREKKEKLKSRSDWAREAQTAVNAFVRERDKLLPCISCGRHHEGSWDAGHYRSVGAMPALRFDLDNIHKQCVPCNQHKSGNILEYRLGLLARIGAERVARLEMNHGPKKYSIEELRAIRDEYRMKLKELQKNGL